MSQTWVIPFVFLAVMLAVWLFAPEARRDEIHERIMRDINYYLICELVLILAGMIALIYFRNLHARQTVRGLAWLALVVVSCMACRRALSRPPSAARNEESDDM